MSGGECKPDAERKRDSAQPQERAQPSITGGPDIEIVVIGGGLAGSEAALQIARLGGRVRLYEMRPVKSTPAHRTDRLAEIVCSNSFKSDQPYNASWLLKEELRRMGSILIRIADDVRVPAGAALAVDRELFAARVTETVAGEP